MFVVSLAAVLVTVVFVQGASHPTTATTTAHGNHALQHFKTLVRHEVQKLWHTVDTNHDGHFEKDDMHHILTDYDDDKNGQVSNAEFIKHFSSNNPDLNMIGKGLFLEFDMNHDGEVSNMDLDLYYQKIDTNDNGHVEKSEFVHYFTEIFTILFVIQLNSATTVSPQAGVGK